MINKKLKHLPHKLKKRIVKKREGLSDFYAYHRNVIRLAKLGMRSEAFALRRIPRCRKVIGFLYSSRITGAFVFSKTEEGKFYWRDIHNALRQYKLKGEV